MLLCSLKYNKLKLIKNYVSEMPSLISIKYGGVSKTSSKGLPYIFCIFSELAHFQLDRSQLNVASDYLYMFIMNS
jgi:hypothetical protein